MLWLSFVRSTPTRNCQQQQLLRELVKYSTVDDERKQLAAALAKIEATGALERRRVVVLHRW